MSARMPPSRRTALHMLIALACLGCAEEAEILPLPPPPPYEGRPDVTQMLREGEAAEYGPADGGGRAWLVRDPEQAPHTVARTPDRFRIVYEAGPLGVATGGAVYLLVGPFWDWSPPQTVEPAAPGYTELVPSADDIELEAALVDEGLLAIEVTGRPLAAGERIEIVYGAGPAMALTDRYAERDAPFWISVDGDGDGTRRVIEDSPRIDVLAGPPERLQIRIPTIARPGETIRVVIAFLDANGNSGMPVAESVRFVDHPPGIELPETLPFQPEQQGRQSLDVRVLEPGVFRLRVRAGELEAQSNPLLVTPDGPRILWGDLHGHSNFSDGTGVPEDYFLYARDVSALDVVALTDHDHWGLLPLARHPALWEEIRAQTRRFHAPGQFVTLLGYEWTSWIHGHRHVLYFEDAGSVYDSVDARYEHPTQLWDALADAGHEALTFAHHSAGGPVATNWEVAPDPRFEPLVEIVSIHGSSEALDSPGLIHEPVPGHFVRDALARGYRLGFVGSGDSHDGHPGAARHEPASSGLAAIIAEEHSREGVLAALRARRVYATNGARILLRMALGGHPMGSEVPVAPGESWSASLYVQAIGDAPLERVELVRSGELLGGIDLEGELAAELQNDLEALAAGEYVYVRVLQEDGGMAWSSPIFIGSQAP